MLHDTGIPLYRQIQDYIREKIEAKEWNVGDQIPTEQMLCTQFNVSRITVTKAINRLVEEGLLRKEQGRGTFVTSTPLVPEAPKLLSFTEEMTLRGVRPGSIILHKGVENASRRLQERLQLSDGTKVWCIERLLTANGTPMGIQKSYLPFEKFVGLGEFIEDNRSIYNLLSTKFGIEPDEAVETYSAVQLDDKECNQLGVAKGSSAFVVERLTYTGGSPFEFVRSLMRSDQFRYSVRLSRR
ncbi:GntR family transcriptional regulator [Alicyclobacillus shizuokensis]|uniref:GntR family transcriptional regulator n=1 Tax=Alicyclobacillus shizuokensis TaxID=392014 RepID=UPI00082BDC86|nr:GntR family transcriptional regulator [Alicyclobacillus shizuokensis]